MKRILVWLVIGILSAALLTQDFGWPLRIVSLVSLLTSLVHLSKLLEYYHRQLIDLDRLRAAYDQLDQQAKLIIRTDVELHRTQEELDHRLTSLMSLHQLSRQLQVSLRPDEVYSKLNPAIVTSFGFSRGLLGTCVTFDNLEWRSIVGVSEATADDLKTYLVTTKLLKHILTNPNPTTLRVASVPDPIQRTLLERFDVQAAVIAGVIPHAGPAGCLLLGRTAVGTTNVNAEEELTAILTNQLATAVENSALYEEAWVAQQALEQKVQQRTHELAQANTELIHLNKAKSDFVSAVSHELRTPLAAIKGYAALLGSGQFGTLAAPQAERIGKIEKHANLLTHLINNLLDIARIESGRVTMEHRPIPVDELLSTVYDMVRPQMEAKHLRYVTDLDGVKEIVGDSQHLQRVLMNLLSNAIKYTPEAGTVQVGLRRNADMVQIAVTDTGCGISSEDLPKLFQEFYRSNDPINQEVRGTGLGLALVKRIVEAHHGCIEVQSEKQRGSTFTVTLPVT